MRVLVVIYPDGKNRPVDTSQDYVTDEDELTTVSDRIRDFMSSAFYELEDEDVSAD